MPVITDPSTPSAEYTRMEKDWKVISDIMAGVTRVRQNHTQYLPQYERESNGEYKRRLETAPWRPEFVDILRCIASKPFGKDVMLKGSPPDEIAGVLDPDSNMRVDGFVDDVDGRGNSLTVFAREAFHQGIAKGLHWIFVDYPKIDPQATIAEQRRAGARPYWVHVPADNVIAMYTEVVGGIEVITHVRIRETTVVRDGYGERTLNRIRILEPGHWELWEQRAAVGQTYAQSYDKIEEGTLSRGGNTSVPLVPFFTGDRIGTMEVRPPLSDIAYMQIELYQALSRQEEILTFAGSPMLAANGLSPPEDGQAVSVGPKAVLYAPASGGSGTGSSGSHSRWEFIQPSAANITEIRKHVEAIAADMRRIGLQPLADQLGSMTATGRTIDAAKAHSAVKAWALMLNDAIERAFALTAEYMGMAKDIQTEVSTDFNVQPYAQFPLQSLAAAREMGDISRKTYLEGLKRFDTLPPDFDFVAEQAEIAKEPPKPEAKQGVSVVV